MKDFDKINPIFYISEDNKNIIKNIEKNLSLIKIENSIKKNLQIKSRVRSIYSSLAIEENTLSLNSIENIIENKLVLGSRKEIQEVKNANELYEHIDDYNWKSEEDFLKAHTVLMRYFDDDNGYYRNHGEGIKKDDEIIYMASNSLVVPSLMESLFEYINGNDLHPIILASIYNIISEKK